MRAEDLCSMITNDADFAVRENLAAREPTPADVAGYAVFSG
jgi:hypothetical protein